MRKKIKILFLATVSVVLLLAGCSASLSVSIEDEVDKVTITADKSEIVASGTDSVKLTVKAYDVDGVELDLDSSDITYTVSGGTVSSSGYFTATTAGSYSIQAKVGDIYSSSVNVTVKRALKITNNIGFSLHLITWEPLVNSVEKIYWFTPDEEYSQYYNNNGDHYVPTLFNGHSNTQKVDSGESYLYFVMTGDSDFGYYRTVDKIKIGGSAADYRAFVFQTNYYGVETDSNQNDLLNSYVLREVTTNGTRAAGEVIKLEKIEPRR